MKPRNKYERKIVEYSNGLRPINKRQYDYAFAKCFPDNHVRRTHKELCCFTCGYKWENKEQPLLLSIDGCTCPHCGKKLKVRPNRIKRFSDDSYFAIITMCHGIQLVRYFYLKRYYEYGKPQDDFISEISRQWIDSNGKTTYMTLTRTMNGDIIYSSELSIKDRPFYIYHDIVYPIKKVSDVIKRNGFNDKFYSMTVTEFFVYLITNTKYEILVKNNQDSVLEELSNHYINEYWRSIRICIKNKYIIHDASMWRDYLNALVELNVDIYNVKYICPVDLKTEHDKYMLLKEKKRIADIEKREKLIIANEKAALELRKQTRKILKNMIIKQDGLNIVVLTTKKDYLHEGVVLNHCVADYYIHNDSIILSARKGDEHLETVEISPSKRHVVQCHGYDNQNTEYHDNILKIVNEHIPVILNKLNL